MTLSTQNYWGHLNIRATRVGLIIARQRLRSIVTWERFESKQSPIVHK